MPDSEKNLEIRRQALFTELRKIFGRFSSDENANASSTLEHLEDIDITQNDDEQWNIFKEIIREVVDVFQKRVDSEQVSLPDDLVARARELVKQNKAKQQTVKLPPAHEGNEKVANGRISFFAFMNNVLDVPVSFSNFFDDLSSGDEDLEKGLELLRKAIPFR